MLRHHRCVLTSAFFLFLGGCACGVDGTADGGADGGDGGEIDTSPPYLVSTTPPNAATEVAVDAGVSIISVVFSQAMDLSTVSVSGSPAFELGEPAWSDDRTTLRFPTPPEPLAPATRYVFSVAGASTAGVALVGANTFAFTTAAASDGLPPTVTGSAPSGTEVSSAANVSLAFSHPMNKASVEAALALSPSVTGTFLWNDGFTQLSFAPGAALALGTPYTVTLGAGAKDQGGAALAAPYTFSFTTAAAPDTTAPTVVSTSPPDGATGVSRSVGIKVTFSEPVAQASAQAAFSIVSPAGLNGGVFSWDTSGTVMMYTFPGGAPLAYGATVAFRVSKVATDFAGNALASQVDRTFLTMRQTTVTVASSTLDGSVSSSGNVTTNTYMMAGEAPAAFDRAFVSFAFPASLPAGATITAATLKVYQHEQSYLSQNPYGASALGSLLAQSVTYGASLTAAAFDANTLQTYQRQLVCAAPGGLCWYEQVLTDEQVTLATDATQSWKQAVVTRKVVDDWSNRGTRGSRSQFRLRFTKNAVADGVLRETTWSTGRDVATYRPTLTIVYEYP